MDAAPLAGGLAVLASGSLLGVVAARNRRLDVLQTLELRFGSDVTTGAVEAALAGMAGLPGASNVVLDVVADRDGIRHRLHAPAATIDVIKGHLRGVLPAARLDAVDGDERPGFTYGVRLDWHDRHPLLQTGAGAETAAALLGSLASPLSKDETVMVRWSLRPARGPHLPVDAGRRPRQQRGLLEALWPSARPLPSEQVGALRNKYGGAVLHGTPTVLVRASNSKRAAHLAGRVTSVVRSRGGARGSLRVRRLSARQIGAGLRRLSLRPGDRYSPAELAPLLGWPIDGPQIVGLALGTAPVLVPSPRIPTTGRVLGVSNAPGLEERQIAQPVIGGLSHSLIVGGTGTGKSTTLAHLLKQDAEAGRGALVIDMKGDLVSDLLALIPAKRHKDVIVLDPAAGGPVPGLKLFGAGRDPEITADVVLGVIRSISSVSASWGPWSAKWLRAGLVTIAQDKTASLADLPFLFTDERYRAQLVGRLRDPMLQDTWAAYDAMSEAERQHQLAAPLGRVEEIVGRRLVRGVLGQQRPKLDLGEALRRGRIVLVSLNPGVLGGPAARLLGALVVHALFQAVLARTALPANLRRPFFTYLDEVKLLADLATPLPELFEMARGQGVGVVAAPQSLAQLPDELRRAALSNAGTLLAFRQNFDDSVLLARELPGIDAEGLQHLGRYEAAARLTLAPGDVAPTVTGRTLPPPEALSDSDEVRRLSAERYGVDPEETDQALRERHGLDDNEQTDREDGDGAAGWQRRRAS